MSLSEDDRRARTRFLLMTLARLGGVAIVMLGILVWQSDAVQEGGSAVLGIPIFVLGLAEAMLLPKFLARRWRTPGER